MPLTERDSHSPQEITIGSEIFDRFRAPYTPEFLQAVLQQTAVQNDAYSLEEVATRWSVWGGQEGEQGIVIVSLNARRVPIPVDGKVTPALGTAIAALFVLKDNHEALALALKGGLRVCEEGPDRCQDVLLIPGRYLHRKRGDRYYLGCVNGAKPDEVGAAHEALRSGKFKPLTILVR